MNHYHPEDRPDPSEQPIRARVPEHVAAGAFSTGVIVMTAQSEFILDFVQNLGRPHQIIARVVLPHHVLPQLVDALHRNMELYKNRWGELPQTGNPRHVTTDPKGSSDAADVELKGNQDSSAAAVFSSKPQPQSAANSGAGPASGGSGGAGGGGSGPINEEHNVGGAESAANSGNPPSNAARQASVQDIYDDLKIRDEFLSGAYANAVMIGHGPHEFSFDFITNFYPNSAVSSRVFLAAGQIPRLYESLKGTWEQLRTRLQNPPGNPFPPQEEPDNDDPFA